MTEREIQCESFPAIPQNPNALPQENGPGNTEEKLRQSEARFRALFEAAPMAIALHDAKGHYLQVNRAYEEMVGYSNEELIGMGIKAVTYPDDIPEGRRLFDLLCEGKRNFYHREKRFLHKDGRTVWARSAASAVRKPTGELEFIVSMVDDITEHKLAQLALRESQRYAQNIINCSLDMIVVVDRDRRIAEFNKAAQTCFGYERGEIVGKHIDVLYADSMDGARINRAIVDDGYFFGEVLNVRKCGEVFPCSLSASILRNRNGDMLGVMGISREVTQQKRLEREILDISAREQRRIAQDLHDGLGQHLTGIGFLAKALEESLAEKDSPELGQVAEIGNLVKQSIAWTRSLAKSLLPLDLEKRGLGAALSDLAVNTQRVFGVICHFESRGTCDCEPTAAIHLYRIAQESISNAVKHGNANAIFMYLSSDHNGLTLMVKDNGVGFHQDPDSSSGMGLRIMDFRARSIGATLSIQRLAMSGTAVCCSLPKASESRQPTS